jgi:hypothetical protein
MKNKGRPRITPEELKTCRISVGMTKNQHEKYAAFAKIYDIPVAELIRIATDEFIKTRTGKTKKHS